MFSIFEKQLIKKYRTQIQDRNFDVRIYDYYFGVPGFFLVNIWENKKTFLLPPNIQFQTRNNPIPLICEEIQNYISKDEKYHNTLREIKELK